MTITTINDLPRIKQYTATAGQTRFDYNYPIFKPEDLVVDQNGQTLTLDQSLTIPSSYSVYGAGNDGGGYILLKTGAIVGDIVTVYSDIVIDRQSQYGQNAAWRAAATNADLNKLTLIDQELKAAIGRTLRFPDIEALGVAPLPSADERAGMTLSFDANGNPIMSTLPTQPVGGWVPNLSSSRNRFVAFQGQTIFQVPGGYTPGFIDVYLNGAKLVNTLDFAATDGVIFTLLVGATFGDNVEVIGYGTGVIAIADASQVQYSLAGGTTRTVADKLGETPTVDDYATGNDVQAALIALEVHASGGPPVTFREGKTYDLSGWTVFDTVNPITIYADGATIIGPTAGTTVFMSCGNNFNIFGGTWKRWSSVSQRLNAQLGTIAAFEVIGATFDTVTTPINLEKSCPDYLIEDTSFINGGSGSGIVIGGVVYNKQNTYVGGTIVNNAATSLSAGEIAGSIVPWNYGCLPNYAERYGFDTTATGAVNTAAINNASLAASLRGGLVYVPEGAANLNGKIVGYSNVYVVGRGMASTVLTQTHATDDGYMAIDKSYCGVASLRINSGAGGNGVRWQASAADPVYPLARDVYVNLANNAAGVGIWCDKPAAHVIYFPYIENCYVQGGVPGVWGTRTGVQFGTTGGSSIVVRPTVIGGRIWNLQTGIDFNRVGGGGVMHTSLDDCQGGTGIGLRFRNATGCRCDVEMEGSTFDKYLQFDAASAGCTVRINNLAATIVQITDAGNGNEVYGDDGSGGYTNQLMKYPTVLTKVRSLIMNAGSVFQAQSGTAPVTAGGGTIATAGLGASRVAPAGNIATVILQAGTAAGQEVTVVNEAAFTITFDIAGTSHVADGATSAIPTLSSRKFIWDSVTALWYRSA